MNLPEVQKLLIKHESCELFPYKCTAGKLTIGVGRNLEDKGITSEEALYLFNNDIRVCIKDLEWFFFPDQFNQFSDSIQSVLVNMRFQLGHTGLKKFKKMIFAFRNKDFAEAVVQMKDSKWHNQVTKRADELIKMVEGEICLG